MVPTVGSFFTPLRLTAAFKEYDACFHISRRKFIPPNFAELRHILNIAQVREGDEAAGRRACSWQSYTAAFSSCAVLVYGQDDMCCSCTGRRVDVQYCCCRLLLGVCMVCQ